MMTDLQFLDKLYLMKSVKGFVEVEVDISHCLLVHWKAYRGKTGYNTSKQTFTCGLHGASDVQEHSSII